MNENLKRPRNKRHSVLKRREYEIHNVYPLYLLGKAGLNNSNEQIDRNQLIVNNKLNYERMKYSLAELFE